MPGEVARSATASAGAPGVRAGVGRGATGVTDRGATIVLRGAALRDLARFGGALRAETPGLCGDATATTVRARATSRAGAGEG